MSVKLTSRQVGDVTVVDAAGRITLGEGASSFRDTIRDLATFERPHQYAEGVDYVIVNGQVAFEGGKMTAARPGRILFGPSTKP